MNGSVWYLVLRQVTVDCFLYDPFFDQASLANESPSPADELSECAVLGPVGAAHQSHDHEWLVTPVQRSIFLCLFL